MSSALPFSRRTRAVQFCALLLPLPLLLLGGCRDKAEPTASVAASSTALEPPAGPSVPTPREDPEPAPTGQASYDDEAFKLELGGPTEVKVGELVEFSVVLTAKGGFKVNEEYPLKFKLSPTSGVVAEAELVDKAAGQVDKHRAELPVKLKVTAPGKAVVAGRLSFSVCTDDRCLIERRDLLVRLNAS